MSTLHRITALGNMRIIDKESGEIILEGKMTGFSFQEGTGCWRVKEVKPKKCPHCGKELKEGDHGDPED